MDADTTIPGYTYGSGGPGRSPIGLADLDALLATVLWTDADERAIRQAGDVLADQVEDVLDVWYGYVGAHPHLVAYFAGADGTPDAGYLAAVRLRFGQWIRDTCSRPYDQAWLDYQHEVALRHTRAKKNDTDHVDGATDHIPLRYLIGFVYPITATMRDFLGRKGHDEAEVDAMHDAWFKAVVLTVTLWSQPYALQDW